MSIVVFCGPTIDAAAVQRVLPEARCRGPATRGDIYLACKLRPTDIALIDGYFDHRLSVWHKEILWALSNGVRVFGAASMGALRAAELDAYGMVGVGQVYEAFARGELEDDDEVAVLHAPEDGAYASQSDAMVNIRATLRALLVDGCIDTEDQAALIAAAKSRHYTTRSFAAVLDLWELEAKRERVARWLSTHGMVDQKRADAQRLLELLSHNAKEPAFTLRRETFRMANTHYWQLLRQSLDAAPAAPRTERPAQPVFTDGPPLESPPDRRDEPARSAAAQRALALALATLAGAQVSAADAQQASEQFRREHDLLTPEATALWMQKHGLDLEGFSRLAHERVLVERFAAAAAAATDAQLPNVLCDRHPLPPSAAPRRWPL